MLLEFHLTIGNQRNTLIDLRNENVHILPKQLNNLKNVLDTYVDYDLSECYSIHEPSKSIAWVEVIEVEYFTGHLSKVLELAGKLVTEFLIFHISCLSSYDELIEEIQSRKRRGEFMLFQIILVVEFDLSLCNGLSDNNGFVSIIGKDQLVKSREVAPKNFIIDKESILGSRDRNLFYFSRIYINKNGFIKPYPSSDLELFNLADQLDYNEVRKSKELKEVWFASPEQTVVCKDCEFRNVCFDNRIPKITRIGSFRKSGECNYNPYIAKWKNEVGYRTLAECGVKSDENGFSIDHEKIAKINEELWGEE